MAKSSAVSKRMLFQRPDGHPYDFWIQSNFPQMTKDVLRKQIQEHGGRVTDFAEFPEHGFLLLDALDPSALYEIKTAFHKPVKLDSPAFERIDTAQPNPLRHVLSSRFVAAVIEKGKWNRYDLLRWGFPVTLTGQDLVAPKAAVQRFRKEVNLGIDPEMEQGWVWATSSVFDSYDPNYRFKEEFEHVDRGIESKEPHKNPKRYRNWVRGRVVATCRLKWQVKFYLHDDIEEEDQEKIITAILENGGATCYDFTEADVILVGCEASEIEDDIEIQNWITRNPRKAVDDDTRTLVKFTSWVEHCIDAGDWKRVEPKTDDVARAYGLFQKGKLAANQKARGRETLAHANSPGRKRKRSSAEDLGEGGDQGSPSKKRKQQQDETIGKSKSYSSGSNSKTSRQFPASLSRTGLEPGSGSTIRPIRAFKGIAVPDHQPSPLKHDANLSSLVLAPPKADSRLKVASTITAGEQDDILETPMEDDHPSIILDTHQHSRISAGSVLTVDSKVGNTTTNTTATGTSKSARSVGPSLPPNAQQIGRSSTSTGVDSEISEVSRVGLDQNLARSPRKSSQARHSIPGFPVNFDADDLAGEIIIASFSPDQSKSATSQARQSRKASVAGKPLSEFEETLVLCWRRISELEYREGAELIEDIVTRWPELEGELRRKAAAASRERKGKGRVSFHEPSKEVDIGQDQDVVLETDYGEGDAKQSQSKRTSIRGSFNLGAARERAESRTPDSAKNSDRETSVESEVRLSKPPSRRSNTLGTPFSSTTVSRSSTLKRVPNRSLSRATTKPSLRSSAKPVKSPRADLVAARSDEQDEEGVNDSEKNEELAPLPVVKTRSQRKRADSVASGNGSGAEEIRPRRGRSASAAPPEQSGRISAPEKATASTGRRTFATKSTGGKRPPRK